MKKILNLILALIIVSANILFAVEPAYALKVELYEPIGNENVKYIKTVCAVKTQGDPTSAKGYKITEWDCKDEEPSDSCVDNYAKQFEAINEKYQVGPPAPPPAEEEIGPPAPPAESNIIYCRRVQIIEADSGSGLIQQYVGTIYKWAASTIGIVAVLVIVVSGIEMIGSDISGDIDAAKSRIGQSLIGLAILFLSAVILYTINPNFFF